MQLTRRRAIGLGGALAAPLALAGCGFVPSAAKPTVGTGTIAFTTWGTDSELAGLKSVIAAFEKAHKGAKVALNAVPYEQMFTTIDSQLQAGNPPDVFRVPYYTFGQYAGAGQLLDLSKHLDSGFKSRFTLQAWAAVQHSGKPYGIPHHTDTSAMFVRTGLLQQAGVSAVPTKPEDAWTWDEFLAAAKKLRGSLPSNKYPFGVNWQGNGVTRWLSWLFQQDGRFLNADLSAPAIDSPAGTKAVDFTKSFFPAKLVPPNDSIKSATYAADSFYNGTTAMVFSGAFAIPDAVKGVKDEWTATFAPRGVRAGTDFGGNALVATAAAEKKASLIAAFFDFATQEAQMRSFCEGASLLPTRADLVHDGIKFAQRPELSSVFVGQAAQVHASDAGQVASPHMSAIITVLKDQLENAFVGGRGTAATLSSLSSGIASAVS